MVSLLFILIQSQSTTLKNIKVRSFVIPVHAYPLHSAAIVACSGVTRVSFRFIAVSFRLVPIYSGTILLHSLSAVAHKGHANPQLFIWCHFVIYFQSQVFKYSFSFPFENPILLYLKRSFLVKPTFFKPSFSLNNQLLFFEDPAFLENPTSFENPAFLGKPSIFSGVSGLYHHHTYLGLKINMADVFPQHFWFSQTSTRVSITR